MSWHVIRTRGAEVCTSRTFPAERQAEREASAWNGTGDYAAHGPTEWRAEVHAGRAPVAPCGRRDCARLSRHAHDGTVYDPATLPAVISL